MLNSTVGCSFPTTPVGPEGKCSTVLPIVAISATIHTHTHTLSLSLSLSLKKEITLPLIDLFCTEDLHENLVHSNGTGEERQQNFDSATKMGYRQRNGYDGNREGRLPSLF
jgi:hypothetical protein